MIKNISSVYFVGIGGIGMSAIARYYLQRGLVVAGYDRTPSALTRDLEREGALVHYEDSVAAAWHDLRELGWGARPYGRPIGQLADELANIAAARLEDRKERQLLDGLAQLWTVHMVPRDSLLHNWSKQRTPTREERAIELYGEGAVIPYDELGGEPPAGKTSVMRVIRQEPVQ